MLRASPRAKSRKPVCGESPVKSIQRWKGWRAQALPGYRDARRRCWSMNRVAKVLTRYKGALPQGWRVPAVNRLWNPGGGGGFYPPPPRKIFSVNNRLVFKSACCGALPLSRGVAGKIPLRLGQPPLDIVHITSESLPINKFCRGGFLPSVMWTRSEVFLFIFEVLFCPRGGP